MLSQKIDSMFETNTSMISTTTTTTTTTTPVTNTMRKNLPKTLDQLIFCKYTLVFSKFLPPKRHKTLRFY